VFDEYLACINAFFTLTLFRVVCVVYKWNHDLKYNDTLPDDSIEHVYIEKFEDIESILDFQDFIHDHGRMYLRQLFGFYFFYNV
jgi:hypothetical protein